MYIKKNSTLSKLKEKERNIRRGIIIDAAEKEFATKHFNKVNMRDIAKRAGISPAMIYRHFPDQRALFVEAFLQGVNRDFESIYRKIDTSADGSITEIIGDFIGYFTRHKQYCRMMVNFFLDGSVYPEVSVMLINLEQRILNNFDIMLKKMNINGDIRFNSHILLAALIGLIVINRNDPKEKKAEMNKRHEKLAGNLAQIFIGMKSGRSDG